MTAPKLLTVKDVAKRANCAECSIRTYQVRGTIPPPDAKIGVTPVWYVSTINAWIASRPKRGRPRKVAS